MTKQEWHQTANEMTGGVVLSAALLLYGVVDLVEKFATLVGVDVGAFATSPYVLILHIVLLVILYGLLKLYTGWYKEALYCLYHGERGEDTCEEHD